MRIKKLAYVVLLASILVAATISSPTSEQTLPRDHSVAKLLETLGDDPSPNRPKMNIDGVSVERGRDIVEVGSSRADGIRSKRQSKYFNCLACHNKEREDPDLADPNPVARLQYVQKHNLPFLPGSPFFGLVNRTKFYNGDYEKKYGELVQPAQNSIREAIQLCAVECSQGRPLEDFEMESVLAYLWTLEYKVSDLGLTDDEFAQVSRAFDSGVEKEESVQLVKSKFLDYSPATFKDPPKDRRSGDGLEGNPANGQLIYDLSCKYCHYENDYSFLVLDDSKLTFKHMSRDAPTYKTHSLYQVIRYGTYPKRGKRAYMPLYTEEKMTDQQMADLRAFIDQQADALTL